MAAPAGREPGRCRPSLGAGSADVDLGAVGAVGVPDRGAGVAGDGEAALVDGGVVPFAEQGAVLATGRTAVHPVDDVVDVAPGGRDGAAGEHAVPVRCSRAWRMAAVAQR